MVIREGAYESEALRTCLETVFLLWHLFDYAKDNSIYLSVIQNLAATYSSLRPNEKEFNLQHLILVVVVTKVKCSELFTIDQI